MDLRSVHVMVDPRLIYKYLAKSGTEVGVQAAIKGAKKLIYLGGESISVDIYNILLESGFNKRIKAALGGVQLLMRRRKWEQGKFFYERAYRYPHKI